VSGHVQRRTREILSRASYLVTLIPQLDTLNEDPTKEPSSDNKTPVTTTSGELEEVEPVDTEHLGWGPKTHRVAEVLYHSFFND